MEPESRLISHLQGTVFGEIYFYFDRAFLASGYDIAPLRAYLNSVSVKNGLPVYAEAEKLFGGLPSFIADSLPDHWGDRENLSIETFCKIEDALQVTLLPQMAMTY